MDSKRDGSIFTFFWVLAAKRGGEDVALEHPPEAWVPFSFGETEHICVTGAYRSEGTAGFYLFSVFKKPYPVHCRNTQSFSCAYRSCTKVYFTVQTNFCQAIGSKQGVRLLAENNRSVHPLSAHLSALEMPDLSIVFFFSFFLIAYLSKGNS